MSYSDIISNGGMDPRNQLDDSMYRHAVKPHDHPDFVGGWVWTELEMRWIEQRIAEAIAAEREACLQTADQCADADMHASMVANAIRARGQA